MSAIDEFEEAREDLEALLIEVLGSVFSEEAMPVWDDALPPGPPSPRQLAIHDEVDDSYTMVEVRTSAIVARVLASRMLLTADPGAGRPARRGRRARQHRRREREVPAAPLVPALPAAGGDDRDDADGARPSDGVTVRAAVLGQVVELTVHLAGDIEGLYWPGSASEEVLETPA